MLRQVSRREVIAQAACVSSIPRSTLSAASERPNVVMILTDQQAASAMGCAGNPHVHTPAIDSIAASGVRFTRSYVTQPLCLPCRASIQTGRFPHEIGTSTNGSRLESGHPMLGRLLAEGGYATAYFGKWHVGVPLQESATGYALTSEKRSDVEIVRMASEFLAKPPRQPFFATISLRNPHDVCELARRERLPQGPIPEAPNDPSELPPLPENFALPQNEPSAIRDVQRKHRDFLHPTHDWSDLEWRQYLWGYYRLVEKADRGVGALLDALSDSGNANNTMLIFTSDHGEGIASHRWNQKQVLYDQAARVPLLVAHPRASRRGATCDALVSTGIDLMPTILGAAAIDSRLGSRYGRSLEALSIDPSDVSGRSRRFVVAETTFGRGRDYGPSGRMVRTERFKYVIYSSGTRREQLFNMQDDPGETRNLAVDSAFGSVLASHREILREWAAETDDRFSTPSA